jgi:hypothetical protein
MPYSMKLRNCCKPFSNNVSPNLSPNGRDETSEAPLLTSPQMAETKLLKPLS